MRIQSSTLGRRVGVGNAFHFQGGCYLENAKTRARAEGIKKLRANHKRADSVDLRKFLVGSDAGEECCKAAYRQGPGSREQQQIQVKT
jgi:hypothetical protein